MLVFLFAASYTMSQFGRPNLTICSQIGLLVDGAVRLKKYVPNDDVDVREKLRRAVPVVARWQHHEQQESRN
jgi:hypothetical protein